MQQIKIFKSLEYDVDAMEKQVNEWLAASKARVISMSGNIAPQSGSEASNTASGMNPSDLVLFLLYEKP
ncbi:MAG TPA: hypothetical protein VGZ22_18165 [Isosphaeraceae bacterium]|jgi:hypothetical protein|nr:hypothetical protein [Isosphaeraceae bacterium]